MVKFIEEVIRIEVNWIRATPAPQAVSITVTIKGQPDRQLTLREGDALELMMDAITYDTPGGAM